MTKQLIGILILLALVSPSALASRFSRPKAGRVAEAVEDSKNVSRTGRATDDVAVPPSRPTSRIEFHAEANPLSKLEPAAPSSSFHGLKPAPLPGTPNRLETAARIRAQRGGNTLLSQGEVATRQVLGMRTSAPAADLLLVNQNRVFTIAEVKGVNVLGTQGNITTAVKQLDSTATALKAKTGKNVKFKPELYIEGDGSHTAFGAFTVRGNQLLELQPSGGWKPVRVQEVQVRVEYFTAKKRPSPPK